MLVLAVSLLGVGAAQSPVDTHSKPTATPALIAAAIATACAAGIVFSLLGISIRHCVTGTTSHSAVVVIITGMGVLTLGPLSFFNVGATQLLATPWQQYSLMYRAGICNLIAFLALVRGLQLTTALHVNMINAGQVALAAVAGVLYFEETGNLWLVLGISLMVVGIFAFGSPVDQEAIDVHV
jgi:DME family drug/metabolite transporter